LNKLIAMILVGGRGTRLGDITKKIAKPAVSFGAKYRLIDFTLSNISNSNISKVGIVTQYEPFELMNYIGSGASWDLDYIDGGIKFLTPYSQHENILWQNGTAHAIKQYYRFITDQKPEYVLILSGDHIYKTDYNEMLKTHIDNSADITIAATSVSVSEASRFGILEINETNRLIGFEEKPIEPKTNLASMGIYIFSLKALETIFFSSTDEDLFDFGKDIIPYCLNKDYKITAHIFNDYWKDVGTVESLYQANMDLLEDPAFLGLNSSRHLPVYSKSLNLPPHIVLQTAKTVQSVIADGSVIAGSVIHSSIAYQVSIGFDSLVEDSVILPNASIGNNVILKKVIVNNDVAIPDGYISENKEVTLITQDNLFEVGVVNE